MDSSEEEEDQLSGHDFGPGASGEQLAHDAVTDEAISYEDPVEGVDAQPEDMSADTNGATPMDDGMVPISEVTVKILQELCKKNKLSATGNKKDLIQRLQLCPAKIFSVSRADKQSIDAEMHVDPQVSRDDLHFNSYTIGHCKLCLCILGY
jgi:hypothetical protein